MSVPTLAKYEEETNKKMLYANILIELASKQTQRHYFEALKSSWIIQMLAAYYALLEEIQRRLNLSPEPGLSAEEILQNMRNSSVHSVEIEQLASLENNRESWIHQLHQAYKELSRSPSIANMDIISTSSADSQDQAITNPMAADLDKYKNWLEQMESLSTNLRNMLSES